MLFVPSGQLSPSSRNIVRTTSCDSDTYSLLIICHNEKAIGGVRRSWQSVYGTFCVLFRNIAYTGVPFSGYVAKETLQCRSPPIQFHLPFSSSSAPNLRRVLSGHYYMGGFTEASQSVSHSLDWENHLTPISTGRQGRKWLMKGGSEGVNVVETRTAGGWWWLMLFYSQEKWTHYNVEIVKAE